MNRQIKNNKALINVWVSQAEQKALVLSRHSMSLLRTKFLFAIIVVFATTMSRAQVSTGESVKYIRSVFKKINSDQNLVKLKIENEELTDEPLDGGASLIGFFNDKKLLKIEQWAGLSYGSLQIEYYFSNDSLIFSYVKEGHFRPSGDSLDHSTIDTKFEGRFYFRNDKLIHQTIKGNGFWNEANDGVSSLLPDSNNYLKFLYSKKKIRAVDSH